MDARLNVYKCHKLVRAARIVEVQLKPVSALLLDNDSPPGPFTVEVPLEYIQRHRPPPGGYYVIYEDGYRSYSPAKAFEEGYDLVPSKPPEAVVRPRRVAR